MRHAAFNLDDGVSFVHLYSHETGSREPLRTLAAFQAFRAGLEERCEVAPVRTVMQEVGSYRSVGAEVG
jgi:hypothetical protein